MTSPVFARRRCGLLTLVLADVRADEEGVAVLSADADANLTLFLAGVIGHLFEALAERDGHDSAEALVLEWQRRNFEN